MKISLKIYLLLKSKVLLAYEWGYYAPFEKPDGFGFKVRGAAFQGIVTIRQHGDNDYFTIYFHNFHCEQVKLVDHVSEKDLITILRANIDGSDSWKEIWKKYYRYKFGLKKYKL